MIRLKIARDTDFDIGDLILAAHGTRSRRRARDSRSGRRPVRDPQSANVSRNVSRLVEELDSLVGDGGAVNEMRPTARPPSSYGLATAYRFAVWEA